MIITFAKQIINTYELMRRILINIYIIYYITSILYYIKKYKFFIIY